MAQVKTYPKWLNQLGLFLWKNFKLQLRSVLSTLLEISVPAIFAIILLPVRTTVNTDSYLNNTVYPAFEVNNLPTGLVPTFRFAAKNSLPQWAFGYQPNNSSNIDKIMVMVASKLNLQLKCNLIFFFLSFFYNDMYSLI